MKLGISLATAALLQKSFVEASAQTPNFGKNTTPADMFKDLTDIKSTIGMADGWKNERATNKTNSLYYRENMYSMLKHLEEKNHETINIVEGVADKHNQTLQEIILEI